MNIPVYYSGCGLGRINSIVNKLLLQQSVNFKNVKDIYLRDSVNKFQNIFKRKAFPTNDVALLTSDCFKANERKKIVGIGFISLNEEFNRIFVDNIKLLIEDLEKQSQSWAIFTNGDENDYKLAKQFYDSSNYKCGAIIPRPSNTQELISSITSFDRMLTCRLHSAIIAFSYQIPTMTVRWSDKITEFYKNINHEELSLDLHFYSPNLSNTLMNIEYTNEDKTRLSNMKNELKNNIDLIIDKWREADGK